MNEDLQNANEGGSFKTINCVDVWIDGPGDKTVRPIRPSLLEHAKAERAKIYGVKDAESPPTKENGTAEK